MREENAYYFNMNTIDYRGRNPRSLQPAIVTVDNYLYYCKT